MENQNKVISLLELISEPPSSKCGSQTSLSWELVRKAASPVPAQPKRNQLVCAPVRYLHSVCREN